jgi:hypothetical protein
MKFNIPIGELAESIAEYKGVLLNDNCEINIKDLDCKVNTPSGTATINIIIKKEKLEGIKLLLANGVEIKCANKHILRYNNADVFADSLAIGDSVETINGNVKVSSINNIDDTTFYDIGIDAPYLYYDADGVLHHNTITTATLSHMVEPYGRSLVIVPNKSLVEQTEEDYINCGLDVGVYFGDRKNLGKTHTICTWQSLNILDKKNKDGSAVLSLAEFLEGVTAVIVDECHQAKAEVLKNLLTRNLRNAPIRWGLTGTVPKEKFEFESIHASLGPVIGSITAKSLQDQGVLSKCHVNVCQLIDVVAHSDYQSELKYLTSDTARLQYIAKMMNKVSQTGNTLILVDRISAGETLRDLMPGSTFVSGAVKVKDRKETYDTIREGTNEVIIATYGVASVGLNIPRIFNLVLLEPGKSFVRVIQSIGRGVRKAKDKDFVQIWDLTSTCKFAKRHLTQRKKFYAEAQYPYTIEKIDWN